MRFLKIFAQSIRNYDYPEERESSGKRKRWKSQSRTGLLGQQKSMGWVVGVGY
jgi:hypothetical protein